MEFKDLSSKEKNDLYNASKIQYNGVQYNDVKRAFDSYQNSLMVDKTNKGIARQSIANRDNTSVNKIRPAERQIIEPSFVEKAQSYSNRYTITPGEPDGGWSPYIGKKWGNRVRDFHKYVLKPVSDVATLAASMIVPAAIAGGSINATAAANMLRFRGYPNAANALSKASTIAGSTEFRTMADGLRHVDTVFDVANFAANPNIGNAIDVTAGFIPGASNIIPGINNKKIFAEQAVSIGNMAFGD